MKEVLGAEFRLFKAALKECYENCDSDNLQEDVIKSMFEMLDESLKYNEITYDRWKHLRCEVDKLLRGYGFKMKV